ncbi:DUF4112 domain-containing protein [Parablastomonas sp. CN1-191]|uniref:DUF4112 domain-containing protein n=1 Tax=Parablastomonas sp. CN1-191 TaxID=3400908 RepID=UPI003BF8A943
MNENQPASGLLGRDAQAVMRRIEGLEALLEEAFTVPGTNHRVGLDAIVGLVPVAGDVVTAAMGLYLVWEAKNLGLPKWKLWRMIGNVAVDSAVGAVPVAGDLFDFAFRSNRRNLKIVRAHLARHHPGTQTIEG